MDQGLRAAMDIMTRNMRRAGYFGYTPQSEADLHKYFGGASPGNPFQTGGNEMTLGDCDANGICSCITFTYDGDASGRTDGTEPSGAVDVFGFRYGDNAIKMLKSGAPSPSCSDGTLQWEAITDDGVVVDGLTFQYEQRDAADHTKPLALNLRLSSHNADDACNTSDTCACKLDDLPCDSCPCGCPDTSNTSTDEECLQIRTVIVTIVGHLSFDRSMTMSIRDRVKVPNDRFCTEDNKPSC
jgi:type II secretory pathway component PulJ